MVVLQLCLLPILSAQAPVSQAPVPTPNVGHTVSSVDPATWLPTDTMIALTLQVDDDTDVSGLIDRIREADPIGAWRNFERQLGRALEPVGLTPEDILSVARGGIALGVGDSNVLEPQGPRSNREDQVLRFVRRQHGIQNGEERLLDLLVAEVPTEVEQVLESHRAGVLVATHRMRPVATYGQRRAE